MSCKNELFCSEAPLLSRDFHLCENETFKYSDFMISFIANTIPSGDWDDCCSNATELFNEKLLFVHVAVH